MNNMKSIIFYSKYCDFCRKLFDEINKIDSLDNYQLVCLEEHPNQFPMITRVPSLIVKNVQKPIVGKHAFECIRTTNQFNGKSNNINYKDPNKHLNKEDNTMLYDVEDEKSTTQTKNNDYSYVHDDNDDKNVTDVNVKLEKEFSDIQEENEAPMDNKKLQIERIMSIRQRQSDLLQEHNYNMNSSMRQKNVKKRIMINRNNYGL